MRLHGQFRSAHHRVASRKNDRDRADADGRERVGHLLDVYGNEIRVADEIGDEAARRRSYSSRGVPCCAIRALLMTMMRSETASASSWSCVT